MKKNYIYIIIGIIIVVAFGIGVFFVINEKNSSKGIKLETAEEMKNMLEDIYSELEGVLPDLETMEIDAKNQIDVAKYTGLTSNENIEILVVSEPPITSQAYSAVVVKVKAGTDIETMKQEMVDNIDVNKWICVSAEKVYVTNSGNIIFLVMASEDWAKPVYEKFKTYVNNEIGKELERTESYDDIELPPEILL